MFKVKVVCGKKNFLYSEHFGLIKKLTNLRKAIWKHSGVQGKYSCLFTEPTAIKTYFSPQKSLEDFPWQPTINTQNRSFSIDTISNYPSPNRYYITTKRLFARGRSLLTLSVQKNKKKNIRVAVKKLQWIWLENLPFVFITFLCVLGKVMGEGRASKVLSYLR